ncbi:hypothetical protein D3C76_1370730 [compost metagenome]
MRFTALGRVVVADVEAHAGGEGQQLVDRGEHLVGVAAGKVTAGGADVRHEQGIADQDQVVADQVGHVRRGMARHMQGGGLEVADAK